MMVYAACWEGGCPAVYLKKRDSRGKSPDKPPDKPPAWPSTHPPQFPSRIRNLVSELNQLLRRGGEVVEAVLGDRPEVLDADAAIALEVYPGLDGDHMADGQLAL